MENKVVPFQTQESGQPSLTEKEFKEAGENIVPLAGDKLRHKLFCESEKAVRIDGLQGNIPIMRAARILENQKNKWLYMYYAVIETGRWLKDELIVN